MFRRAITVTGGINISRQIRGPALKEDVLLTVCPEGIVISPCGVDGKAEEGNAYQAKSYFNQYNRLYIPKNLTEAAHIGRIVKVTYRPDGTLLLSPDQGDCCMLCGSVEDLHQIGKDQLVCRTCIEKIYKSSGGDSNEE